MYYFLGPLIKKVKIEDEHIDWLLMDAETMRLEKKYSAVDRLAGHIDEETYNSAYAHNYIIENLGHHFTAYFEKMHSIDSNLVSDGGEQNSHNINNLSKVPADQLRNWVLDLLWTNFMKAGEFNPPHHHSGHISFVLYLSIPDEYQQELDNHKALSPPPGNILFLVNDKQMTFTPEPGAMYIFPSSLEHMVFPFRSDGERVSMSGNISLKLN